jgi:hypothetical protein
MHFAEAVAGFEIQLQGVLDKRLVGAPQRYAGVFGEEEYSIEAAR